MRIGHHQQKRQIDIYLSVFYAFYTNQRKLELLSNGENSLLNYDCLTSFQGLECPYCIFLLLDEDPLGTNALLYFRTSKLETFRPSLLRSLADLN